MVSKGSRKVVGGVSAFMNFTYLEFDWARLAPQRGDIYSGERNFQDFQ